MFSSSHSRILPDLVFNNLKECKYLLKECDSLKALPSITINGSIKLLEKLSFNYIFGSEDYV